MKKDIKITKDGFIFKIVTDLANELFNSDVIELYILHEDDSESLVEKSTEIREALENGLDIGISVGHVPENKGYLVNEKGSNLTFAVIRGSNNDKLIYGVAKAVKDEYCYDTVDTRIVSEVNSMISITCECVIDGEEEIRDVELHLTAIY